MRWPIADVIGETYRAMHAQTRMPLESVAWPILEFGGQDVVVSPFELRHYVPLSLDCLALYDTVAVSL